MMLCIPALGLLVGCAPSSDSRLADNKEVVRQFTDAINNLDFERLDELVMSDVVRHTQAGVEFQSLQEFKDYLREGAEAFPDAQQGIITLVAEGDYVAAYMNWTATQEGPYGEFPASGKTVTDLRWFALVRLEEGKVAEIWAEWDNLNMLTQLGHNLLLSGT